MPVLCDRNQPFLFATASIYAADTAAGILEELQKLGLNVYWEENLEDHYVGSLRGKTASMLKSSKCRGVLFFSDRDALQSNRCRRELSYAVGPQVRKSHNRVPLTVVSVDLEDPADFVPEGGLISADDPDSDLLTAAGCWAAVSPILEDALHYAWREEERGALLEGLSQQLRFLCPEVFCLSEERLSSSQAEEDPDASDFDPTAYDSIFASQTEAALQQYQQRALQGDAAAQMQLGFFYEMGYGAEADTSIAANWYRKAAEQDHVSAQYSLGELLYRGDGVPQDPEEAAVWFRKAASGGNRNAQAYLSEMYFAGQGVTQDMAKAARWAEKAADQGDDRSQFLLGWMYEQGRGVPQDLTAAARRYQQAADGGNTDAMCNLAVLYSTGRGVTQDDEKAVELFSAAAEKEHPTAMYALGMHYASEGPGQDLSAAFGWYERSAKAGNTNAFCRLGSLYENGDGTEQDFAQAKEWYTRAADAGEAEGWYCLGILSYLGHGTPVNYPAALELLETAADAGLSAAQAQLGYMYQAGEGLEEPDYQKAVAMFEKAAEQNNVTAIRNLAAMYEKGVGVEANKPKAVELFTRASRLAALGWE